MRQAIKEILYRVAEEVLEKIAFIFSFPEDERDPIHFEEAVIASVSFTGLFNGSVIMAVSQQVLPELTGNMLGIENDDEISFEEQYDALKELINVICGNLLPAVAGKQIIFNVETPKIVDDPVSVGLDKEPLSIAKLSIEDSGMCDVLLYINGEIPENLLSDANE